MFFFNIKSTYSDFYDTSSKIIISLYTWNWLLTLYLYPLRTYRTLVNLFREFNVKVKIYLNRGYARFDLLRILGISQGSSITSLHLAIDYGDTQFIQTLVNMNIDVNVPEPQYGRTALHLAVLKNNIDACQLLLDNNANINAMTMDDLTPLHMAASMNSIPLVKMLLEYGVDVNPKSKLRLKMPLFLAIEQNNPEMVELLLDAGASIKAASNQKISLLDHAKNSGDVNKKMHNILMKFALRDLKRIRDDELNKYQILKTHDDRKATVIWLLSKKKKTDTLRIKVLRRKAIKCIWASAKKK